MMEAVTTSETSVLFYKITLRNNTEDGHLKGDAIFVTVEFEEEI
jgi:hypothetical protein